MPTEFGAPRDGRRISWMMVRRTCPASARQTGATPDLSFLLVGKPADQRSCGSHSCGKSDSAGAPEPGGLAVLSRPQGRLRFRAAPGAVAGLRRALRVGYAP
jgi:hypothetical protein